MVWSNLIRLKDRSNKSPLRVPIKKSTQIKLDHAYIIPNAKRHALARARMHPKCSECGWRLCTCNKTLDEWS